MKKHACQKTKQKQQSASITLADALATLDYLSLVISAHPDEPAYIDRYAKVEALVTKLERDDEIRRRALERARSIKQQGVSES